MAEVRGELVFGTIIIAICAVLVALNDLSTENFMQIVLLVLGAAFGAGYGYVRGYSLGKKS